MKEGILNGNSNSHNFNARIACCRQILCIEKPDKKEVEHMFECYQKEVTVKSKESLGE